MNKSKCKECGFEEDYEKCEFGLTWQQADGTCPNCGGEIVDEYGNPTKETIVINVINPDSN